MKDKIVIIIVLMLVSIGLFSGCIYSKANTLLDIENKLITYPTKPYDIAKLESIKYMNESSWTIIVRLIDIDTNSTVYKTLVYDLNAKSFKDE